MHRLLLALGVGVLAAAEYGFAQQPAPLVKSTSTFVEVPALVRSASGEPVMDLAGSQFRIFDNGIPQKVVMESAQNLPIALLILVQTGGAAREAVASFADLPRLLPQTVGGTEHELMLVTFDSKVEEIWHFPPRADGVIYALTHPQAGDDGAAIRDAVSFGVRQLQSEPGRFRRVVLLISQRNDAGSKTSEKELLKQLGTASTVIYNLQFPAAGSHKRKKLRRAKHRSAAPSTDLQSVLDAMDADTGGEIAAMTGGECDGFNDQRSFNSQLLSIIQAIHDSYQLGFQPSDHRGGFHSIRVELKSAQGHERVTARGAYWVDSTAAK
ncbi:MAG: VWA domain-containing protein [Acidobacteriota bacterium]